MERKLTAILCADVFGYSRLMGGDEEATLVTLTALRFAASPTQFRPLYEGARSNAEGQNRQGLGAISARPSVLLGTKRRMYLAYVDESGNIGLGAKGTKTFTLACVIVDTAKWVETFEALLRYRRYLKRKYGLPMRAEVKANYLLGNRQSFAELGLSEGARRKIYRQFLSLQQTLGLICFAIVIRKDLMVDGGIGCREKAWEFLFQRLERFTTNEKAEMILMYDEGEGEIVRAIARKARRAGLVSSMYGAGYLKRPASLIFDNAVPKKSHQSYFIQLADLNAYAAFRRLYPPPLKVLQIVPTDTWDALKRDPKSKSV